ncbi:hypothetical protein Sjap_012470 [Stephania japonica]|uniref:Peptidase A1 domain-containing protein n=1 Tax=Stephania japonica TaxID=461633 RepID=A0AAP0IXT8_9MAGN
MMASSPSILLLLIYLSSSTLPSLVSPSPPSTDHITISLDQHKPPSSQDPLETLAQVAKSSLARAKHLKKPNPHTSSSSTPLSPQSYGGYSISLRFGTPPQPIPFILDTGSDLVWFPCTHRYLCRDCPKASKPTPSFIPKLSHSSKLIGCRNPKCLWIHSSPDLLSRCDKSCHPPHYNINHNNPKFSNTNTIVRRDTNNCTQLCPPYLVLYGSGSTGGVLLSETLSLPGKSYPDFALGCSLFSSRAPSGIAGFGRGPASLPSQLRLTKFSYCLVSHRFDAANKSSSLDLAISGGTGKTPATAYTKFLPNPTVGNPAFGVYYYLALRRISIGGVQVKIAAKYLSPQPDGNGGVIVDSGTTFTVMEGPVFEPVAREFVKQVENRYKRLRGVEGRVGLSPCFNVSGAKDVTFPKLVLHFKGGADMELPSPNFIAFVGRESDVVCMTVSTVGGDEGEGVSGPAVILGNHLMQNFYVEYDLMNNRFGFRRQVC